MRLAVSIHVEAAFLLGWQCDPSGQLHTQEDAFLLMARVLSTSLLRAV